MERRFARVQIDQPNPEEAEAILKGLRPRYEEHHGVEILDEAIRAAVQLSVRYINSRQLPDKAIDLMDEAAAKVRLDKADELADTVRIQERLLALAEEKEQAIVFRHRFYSGFLLVTG